MIGRFKVAVVVPYFGSLPNYFELWLKSVEKNEEIDWLIITDCDLPRVAKSNVKWIKRSFAEIQQLIKEKFDFEPSIGSPYKLCDYKPAYGDIFCELLSGYDFWGYCDVDLVFGHISNFIKSECLEKYDKLFKHGHFGLIRNCEEMNKLYLREIGEIVPYRTVYSSNCSFYFDEGKRYGFPEICKKYNHDTYYQRCFADLIMSNCDVTFKYGSERNQKIIKNGVGHWKNGYLYIEGDNIRPFEILYMHFQKRKMTIGNIFNDDYYIGGMAFDSNKEVAVLLDRKKYYLHYFNIRISGVKKKIAMFSYLKQNNILDKWRMYV